jgi:rubrerythrin
MVSETSSEDVVFLLDTSTSMYRDDHGNGSRLMKSIQAIQQLIQKKMKVDAKDRYAAITFAKSSAGMADMFFNEEPIMEFIYANAEFGHETDLGNALSQGIQLILKQMRFIGQKLSRIVIFSDGLTQMYQLNPLNVAKIAVQLGIFIDVVRFGKVQIPGNVLKKLSDMTNGEYFYVASEQDLVAATDKLAKKKEKKHATIFDKQEDDDFMAQDIMADLADIPLKVEQMTEQQKEQAIYNLEKGKKLVCTICYSDKSMADQTSFFGTGRFCPNCLTPVHLDCAIMWAEQQNAKKGGGKSSGSKTFRCTHCFYLMKIPSPEIEKKGKELELGQSGVIRKVAGSELANSDRKHICNTPECGVILQTTDKDLYQCSVCSSFFHRDCAAKEYQKDRRCPYCRTSVKFEDLGM